MLLCSLRSQLVHRSVTCQQIRAQVVFVENEYVDTGVYIALPSKLQPKDLFPWLVQTRPLSKYNRESNP